MIQAGLDQEAAVASIVGRYTDWKDARRNKEYIIQECISNYLVVIDESKYENWPWRCQVADTFSQETADTIGSGLRNGLFPVNEEYFELIGLDELGLKHAKTFQKYVQTLLHKMKFIERLGPWCKQLPITGNAPLLLKWETLDLSRRKRIRTRTVQEGTPSYPVQDERTRKFDGPSVEVLDWFDVVHDPVCKRTATSPFIRRAIGSKEQVKATYKGVDLSSLEGEASAVPEEPSDTLKRTRQRMLGIHTTDPNAAVEDPNEQLEILEVHGDWVLEGETHKDIHAAVINRKLLVLFDRNVYWGGRQILMGTYDDLWFTPFGKGALEPVRGIQELIDTFSCQKADILNIITNGCFAYIDDGVIDPDAIYLRPRGGIEVGNIANIKELHPNQNISLTYGEIDSLRARGERSTGKSRFDMGQAPGGRRTAYEASLIRQGGGARDIDVIKHLANDVMEYVLEWMVVSIQQFKWDSNELGPETNEILLGDYQVNYLGADLTASRQFELQQLMQFLDMSGRYPALAEAMDAPNLLDNIADVFHFRRPVVKPRQQYEQEQAQKRAMMQAEMMAGGGTPLNGQGGPGMPVPVNGEEAAALAGEGA